MLLNLRYIELQQKVAPRCNYNYLYFSYSL